MAYNDLSGESISERDRAFAKAFADFVNGDMCSPDQTGMELTRTHRYLQQEMFKVFLGFMKQLAYNYQEGRYDDRNEWASRLSAEAYQQLVECDMVYDPQYPTSK